MKRILSLLILTTLFFSCGQQNNNQANIDLVEKYVKAVEELDYETIESVLDDDYLGMGPSFGDSIRKPEVIETMKVNFEHLYESIDYDLSKNIAVTMTDNEGPGEWVSNWAELTITYKEDQNRIRLWANSVYKIKDGKIIKSFTFYNEADALDQLGYVFINPDDL